MSWIEKDDNELSYIKLGITLTIAIFIGVLGANVISTEISKEILSRQLASLSERASERLRVEGELIEIKLKKQAEISRQNQIERNRIAEKQNRIIRIERERNTNASRQRIETCNFWKDQYRKTKRVDDRIHRDNSCKAAKKN
jgi:hypothetical protein